MDGIRAIENRHTLIVFIDRYICQITLRTIHEKKKTFSKKIFTKNKEFHKTIYLEREKKKTSPYSRINQYALKVYTYSVRKLC
jgi:hypothetical protein